MLTVLLRNQGGAQPLGDILGHRHRRERREIPTHLPQCGHGFAALRAGPDMQGHAGWRMVALGIGVEALNIRMLISYHRWSPPPAASDALTCLL